MNKLKYLLLIMVMVLLPINVFAAAHECEVDLFDYFILESADGNKIENGDLTLESSKKDYSQELEYVSNGVYKIKYGKDLNEYYDSLKITNNTDSPMFLIKYNNEYIGVISGSSLYKYSKDTDYTTVNSFIDSVYKNTGVSLISEQDQEWDKFYSKYYFKDNTGNYVRRVDLLCGEDADYNESRLPIITYKPGIIENKNHTGSIYIKSSELVDISNKTEELNYPTIKDLQINFDLKFNSLNDYVTYKLIIRNDTDKDYELTNNDFNTSDYITYDFKFESDDKVIQANSDKIAYVTIKYSKEVPKDKLVNGGYTEDNKLGINFNRKEESIFDNPKTGIKNIIILIIILSIIGLILYISIKNNSKFKYINILLIGLLIIPLTVRAIELLQIDVITHIEISGDKEFCYFDHWKRDENGNYTIPVKTYFKYKDGMTWYDYINSDYNKFNLDEMKELNPDLFDEPTEIPSEHIEPNEIVEERGQYLPTYYFGYETWVRESDRPLYYPGGTNTRQYDIDIPNAFLNNDYFNCDSNDKKCKNNNMVPSGSLVDKINDKTNGCYNYYMPMELQKK